MVDYITLPKVNHVTFNPDKVPLTPPTYVTVTADKGFIIKHLNLQYSDYGTWRYYGYYDNGKMYVNFLRDPLYNAQHATFNATVVPDPNVQLTGKIPKVEHVTFTPNEVTMGTTTTVKATADTGYIIKSIEIYRAIGWQGSKLFDANYDTSKGTITFNLTQLNNDNIGLFENATVNADVEPVSVPKPVPKPIPVIYTLPTVPHATFEPNQAELGKTTKITITPDVGYKLSKGSGLILNGKALGSFQGTNIYNLDLTGYTTPDQLKNAQWDLDYEKTVPKPIQNKIPIKLNLTHCTSDTDSIVENTTKKITLTADQGYIFDDDVIVYSYSAIAYTNYYSKILTKANNKNTITVTIMVGGYTDYQDDLTRGLPVPSITAKATKPDVIPTGTQSINIYDMTDGEINSFMNSVVSTIDEDGLKTYDFTAFVNQIYRIPFNIPKEDTTDTTSIKVGKYDVPVNTKQVNKDKLIIDCGTIKVEPHYNNANDYSPLECMLYLPFTKEISLNINDIINHPINIKYNIDLLNGETTVIVSNENNDIYTGQFNISTSLEYYGLHEDKIVNHLNSTYINDIMQAYIKLIYNKPIDNLVSYETNEHGTLKDYHGFTKIKNIDLKGNYNYNEMIDIISLLKQGVYIK